MPVWKIAKIKALLSSILEFLFFVHSAQINSLIATKFLQLKSTNNNARNVIFKIKSYCSQPVQGTRHTTLLCYYEN